MRPKRIESNKAQILRYVITSLICLIVAVALMFMMRIYEGWETLHDKTNWNFNSELTKVMFILSNSTFIVGILTLCFGLFVLVADGGVFEMLSYGLYRFGTLFKKDPNRVKFETFYDYHVYKSEQPRMPFLYLVIVGGVYTVISVIFTLIYLFNM